VRLKEEKMVNLWYRLNKCLFLMVVAGILIAPTGYADENKDMKGWEIGSAYNNLYNPTEMDKLKGTVVGFKEVKPFSDMAPGIALILKDREDETVTVHIGPKVYLDENPVGVRKGDRVSIKGVWTEINDDDVFIASKIKRGEHFEFKVRRTSDGKPFWAMGKEELAKERASLPQ